MRDPRQAGIEIRRAIKAGELAKLKRLIGTDDSLLNMRSVFGTWVHVAASLGQLKILEYLVSKGLDIDTSGGIAEGTALNEAAAEGHVEVVEYLVSCGAKLDVSEPQKNPLFAAAHGGHTEVAKILIDAGIDTAIKYSGRSMKNMDALAFALQWGSSGIADLLSGTTTAPTPRQPRQTKARTTSPSSRALYYKLTRGAPARFLELRRADREVMVCSGAVKTWGVRKTIDCASSEAAGRKVASLASRAVKDGFKLALETTFTPGVCNFDALRAEIREGARQAFEAVRKSNAGLKINAYALLSDDSAMTIVSAANSATADVWNCAEWDLGGGDAFLDIPYRRMLAEFLERPDDGKKMGEKAFVAYRDGLFESCVQALEELDREGFFGKGKNRERTIVLFQVSDSYLSKTTQQKWVTRLNGKSAGKRYRDWEAT